MAKKKGNQGPNQQNLQAYQRMNFLHQAATLMSTMGPVAPNQPQKKGDWNGDPEGSFHALGRYYNNHMKKISKRLVLRLDPTVKRSVCKRCDTTLIPALTSTTRIKSRPETTTVTICKVCNAKKKWVARRSHQLFNERPDVILSKDKPA